MEMEVAVSKTEERLSDEENLFFDRESLASDIEWILSGDAQSPEILARLFIGFGQAMDSGLEGINQTRKALVMAIELVYLHSGAHVAALQLYRLSLEGELRGEANMDNLINAIIEEKSTAGGRASNASGRAKSRA
jgi:hypothetical protein